MRNKSRQQSKSTRIQYKSISQIRFKLTSNHQIQSTTLELGKASNSNLVINLEYEKRGPI